MRAAITKENVEKRLKPILNNKKLWILLNQISEKAPYKKSEIQERYFVENTKGFESLKNNCIKDPKHLWDLRLGDFYDNIFGITVDLKIGEKYAGAISKSSLDQFTGWYLCLNPYGTKAYFINSTYLNKLALEGKLQTNGNYDYYGEVHYKNLIDNENVFCVNDIDDFQLF